MLFKLLVDIVIHLHLLMVCVMEIIDLGLILFLNFSVVRVFCLCIFGFRELLCISERAADRSYIVDCTS